VAFAVYATPAVAHEFVASKEGSLTVHHHNAKFTVREGSFLCEKPTSEGKVTAGKHESLVFKFNYGECKWFGSPMSSTAEFGLNANGTLSVLANMAFKPETWGCYVAKVSPEHNAALEAVTFTNEPGGKLKVRTSVHGITYTTTGELCGLGGKNMEISEEAEVELPGGTIEWK